MTYRGIIKEGKVELEDGVALPEGTMVKIRVAMSMEEWIAELKKLSEEISRSIPPGVSIVDELIRSRR